MQEAATPEAGAKGRHAAPRRQSGRPPVAAAASPEPMGARATVQGGVDQRREQDADGVGSSAFQGQDQGEGAVNSGESGVGEAMAVHGVGLSG